MIDKILAMANEEWPTKDGDPEHRVVYDGKFQSPMEDKVDLFLLSVWHNRQWYNHQFGNSPSLNPKFIIDRIREKITPDPKQRVNELKHTAVRAYRDGLRKHLNKTGPKTVRVRCLSEFEPPLNGLANNLRVEGFDMSEPLTAKFDFYCNMWTFIQRPKENLTTHILRHAGLDQDDVTRVTVGIEKKAKVERIELKLTP